MELRKCKGHCLLLAIKVMLYMAFFHPTLALLLHCKGLGQKEGCQYYTSAHATKLTLCQG